MIPSKLFCRSSYKLPASPSTTLIAGRRAGSGAALLAIVALVVAIFATGTPRRRRPSTSSSMEIAREGSDDGVRDQPRLGDQRARQLRRADPGRPVDAPDDDREPASRSVQPEYNSTLVVNPNPPTAAQNTGRSRLEGQERLGRYARGRELPPLHAYDPYSVKGNTIDYADGNVGLRIDGAGRLGHHPRPVPRCRLLLSGAAARNPLEDLSRRAIA
jgi:hypothetical protein